MDAVLASLYIANAVSSKAHIYHIAASSCPPHGRMFLEERLGEVIFNLGGRGRVYGKLREQQQSGIVFPPAPMYLFGCRLSELVMKSRCGSNS